MEHSKLKNAECIDFKTVALRYKIGVALGIIRCCPAGKSIRKYTNDLIARYQLSLQDWEKKLQTARDEIFALKQQLYVTRSEVASSSKELEILYPTPSEPDDLGEPATCLSCDNLSYSPAANIGQCLQRNTSFLNSILRLQASHQCLGSRAQGSTLLREAIIYGLKNMIEIVNNDAEILTSHLFMEMVTSILKVTEEQTFSMDWEFQGCFRQLFSSIILKILSTDSFQEESKYRMTVLQDVLKKIGTNRSYPVVLLEIECLLDGIAVWSQKVRKLQLGGGQAPSTVESENIFLIISTLQNIILTRIDVLGASKINGIFQDIADHLEECLLHLTSGWPLLAHALWQISFHLYKVSHA